MAFAVEIKGQTSEALLLEIAFMLDESAARGLCPVQTFSKNDAGEEKGLWYI